MTEQLWNFVLSHGQFCLHLSTCILTSQCFEYMLNALSHLTRNVNKLQKILNAKCLSLKYFGEIGYFEFIINTVENTWEH